MGEDFRKMEREKKWLGNFEKDMIFFEKDFKF